MKVDHNKLHKNTKLKKNKLKDNKSIQTFKREQKIQFAENKLFYQCW